LEALASRKRHAAERWDRKADDLRREAAELEAEARRRRAAEKKSL
jgi:hypothetical protein